ncbi:hypothetical protein [Urbifossiella limnaea]|uniref:hypothetical protein n=1 Tax=Urbifossiella limnaea TaxID=2528023 RepID=UPI0011A38B35|nr:hypothetical protein [Urbifossiella limnaea]
MLANGRKFPHPTQLLTITGKSDPQAENIPFRADFPNPDGLIRHGLTGTVQVHRRLAGAVVIPQRATTRSSTSGTSTWWTPRAWCTSA